MAQRSPRYGASWQGVLVFGRKKAQEKQQALMFAVGRVMSPDEQALGTCIDVTGKRWCAITNRGIIFMDFDTCAARSIAYTSMKRVQVDETTGGLWVVPDDRSGLELIYLPRPNEIEELLLSFLMQISVLDWDEDFCRLDDGWAWR